MAFVSNVRNTPIQNTLKESTPKIETNICPLYQMLEIPQYKTP